MKKTAVFLSAMVMSGLASATDVRSFDLGGVRLGMNPAEASAALQAKCRRDHGKFDVTPFAEPNPYLPGKKYKLYMHCEASAGKTSVHVRAIPGGAIVVERVIYEMPWNNDNVKALRANAIAKYGEPTNIIQMGPDPEWCESPHPSWPGGPACQDDSGLSAGARLRITSTKAELYDPRPSELVQADRKAKETVKPSL